MLPEIIADENIDSIIIDSLRIKGFNVLSVSESHRGMEDEKILDMVVYYYLHAINLVGQVVARLCAVNHHGPE